MLKYHQGNVQLEWLLNSSGLILQVRGLECYYKLMEVQGYIYA